MLLWFYDQKNKSRRRSIMIFRQFFPLCPRGNFSMAVSELRNSKRRKRRGNPLIASFTFNPIPGTQNTLFKEEVCIWDGTFQFLVGEWHCLCWPGWTFSSAVTEHTLCPCLTKPARVAELQPRIARDMSGKSIFFCILATSILFIMEFYGLLQRNCAPFLWKFSFYLFLFLLEEC